MRLGWLVLGRAWSWELEVVLGLPDEGVTCCYILQSGSIQSQLLPFSRRHSACGDETQDMSSNHAGGWASHVSGRMRVVQVS